MDCSSSAFEGKNLGRVKKEMVSLPWRKRARVPSALTAHMPARGLGMARLRAVLRLSNPHTPWSLTPADRNASYERNVQLG